MTSNIDTKSNKWFFPNYIWCSWCKTFNHTAKATSICSTSEKQLPATPKCSVQRKQIPDIEIPAHRYKTVCFHQWKYENKFQSQNNHDSFNCRTSKSNPHLINQKSVIFSVHKTHVPHRTNDMALSHSYFHTPFRCGNSGQSQRHHNVHRSEDMD